MKWRSNSVEPTKSVAQLPARPVAGLRVLDLERLAGAELEHRLVAQREDLAGRAVGDAEDLALDRATACVAGRRAPIGAGGDRVDLGRRASRSRRRRR